MLIIAAQSIAAQIIAAQIIAAQIITGYSKAQTPYRGQKNQGQLLKIPAHRASKVLPIGEGNA
jgi:hypothetical protein